MLCTRCLGIRRIYPLILDGDVSRRRYATGTGRSRVSELIVHETPKSTRTPRGKIIRDRNLQRKAFEAYHAYVASNPAPSKLDRKDNKTAPTYEALAYLDELKSEYVNRTLEGTVFDKLTNTLDNGFTSTQLKKHYDLQKTGVVLPKYCKRTKTIEYIFMKAWNVRKAKETPPDTRPEPIKTLSRADVFFLLQNQGSILQTWSEDFSSKIELDQKALTLSLFGNAAKRRRLLSRTNEYLARVQTEILDIRLPENWQIDPALPALLGVLIEMTDEGKLKFSFMPEDKAKVLTAQQLVRASIRLEEQKFDSLMSVPAGKELVERRIVRHHPPFVERDQHWTRTTTHSTGVLLPRMMRRTGSEDLNPVFDNQVGARISRPSIKGDETILNTLSSVMAHAGRLEDNPECKGTTVASFGHFLRSGETLQAFTTDVPRQFSVIRALKPVVTEDHNRHILRFVRAEGLPELDIDENLEIAVDFNPTEAPSYQYSPTYLRALKSVNKSTVLLPANACDLLFEAVGSVAAGQSDEIKEYLDHCDFDIRNGACPPLLKLNGVDWTFDSIEVVTSLELASTHSNNVHAGLAIHWQSTRGNAFGANYQGLSVSAAHGVPPEAMMSLLVEISGLLDRH